jgi:hypothetical protein
MCEPEEDELRLELEELETKPLLKEWDELPNG